MEHILRSGRRLQGLRLSSLQGRQHLSRFIAWQSAGLRPEDDLLLAFRGIIHSCKSMTWHASMSFKGTVFPTSLQPRNSNATQYMESA